MNMLFLEIYKINLLELKVDQAIFKFLLSFAFINFHFFKNYFDGNQFKLINTVIIEAVLTCNLKQFYHVT